MNCHNFSGKPRKFSRSRMTKRTAPLSSSREIYRPRKVSLNYETVRIFYEILGDGFRVKPENGIFEKFQKMASI